MKLTARLSASLVLLSASIITLAASGGCGTSLHKAEVSAGAIAASLHTAAQTNHDNTLETTDERKTVAGLIKGAAEANDDFLGVLKVTEAKGGTPDVASIGAAFQKLAGQVDQLNDQGVLKIKDPKAQANFSLLISSIKAELAIVQSLFPAPGGSAKLRSTSTGGVIAAFVLTAEEIEELIGLAIAAGSALVPKLLALRGATGAEIIADAEADDKAAEEIADEDLGEVEPDPEQKPKPE